MRTAVKTVIVALACALAVWAQPTPKFPGELPTWSDILRAKNSAVASLTGAIGPDDLTIPVSNGLAFAAPGAVTIEGEHIKICAVSAGALTVCSGGRGFDGSQKAAHAAGKLVDGRVLSRHHEQLGAEVIALAESLGSNLQNVVKNGGLVTPGAVPVVSAGGTLGESSGFGFDVDGRLAVKLRDFVSVKDFGAVGDGVTNDTAAIKAARDYAVSQAQSVPVQYTGPALMPALYFPSGKYLIKEKHALCPTPAQTAAAALTGWRLKGDSYSTFLYLDFPADEPDGYACYSKDDGITRSEFSDFWIYGKNGYEKGFYFYGGVGEGAPTLNTFRNLRLQNLKEGVTVDGPADSGSQLLGDRFYFEKVTFKSDIAGAIGYWVKNNVQAVGHVMVLPDFEMLANNNVGIYVQSGGMLNVFGPSLIFDGNGSIAIKIEGNDSDGGLIGAHNGTFAVYGAKSEMRSSLVTDTPVRLFYLKAQATLSFYESHATGYDSEIHGTTDKYGQVNFYGGKNWYKYELISNSTQSIQNFWFKPTLYMRNVKIRDAFADQVVITHSGTDPRAMGRAECEHCQSSEDNVLTANAVPADGCINCERGLETLTGHTSWGVFRVGAANEGLPRSGDAYSITIPTGQRLKSITVYKVNNGSGAATSGVVTLTSQSGTVLFTSPTWSNTSVETIHVPLDYLCSESNRVFSVTSTSASRLEGYITYEYY